MIEELEKLQSLQNNGRGVDCVRTVIMYLKLNDTEHAKAVVNNEWDKISSYHAIAEFFKKHNMIKLIRFK